MKKFVTSFVLGGIKNIGDMCFGFTLSVFTMGVFFEVNGSLVSSCAIGALLTGFVVLPVLEWVSK